MTTRRLNKTVNALRAHLVRNEVPNPDKVAKLLLQDTTRDTDDNPILHISGKGRFSTVIGKAVSATELRTMLIKADLVVQTSYDSYRQWTVGITPKLAKYRAQYEAECQGFDNPVQAMNAMETRIEKKLAKQSANNKQLTADLTRAQEQLTQQQGQLAQNQGQLMSTQWKLEELQEQIQALWSAIEHIEQHDAPVTVEKIERHLKAV